MAFFKDLLECLQSNNAGVVRSKLLEFDEQQEGNKKIGPAYAKRYNRWNAKPERLKKEEHSPWRMTKVLQNRKGTPQSIHGKR